MGNINFGTSKNLGTIESVTNLVTDINAIHQQYYNNLVWASQECKMNIVDFINKIVNDDNFGNIYAALANNWNFAQSDNNKMFIMTFINGFEKVAEYIDTKMGINRDSLDDSIVEMLKIKLLSNDSDQFKRLIKMYRLRPRMFKTMEFKTIDILLRLYFDSGIMSNTNNNNFAIFDELMKYIVKGTIIIVPFEL